MVSLPERGDFKVNEKFLFEVGGKVAVKHDLNASYSIYSLLYK